VTLDRLEAILWSQVANLASGDSLRRQTAMEAVRIAVSAYAETAAGEIVHRRRTAVTGKAAR
jgi:hypothetical protein